MVSSIHQERRRAPRTRLTGPVRVSIGGDRVDCAAINVSEDGMLLRPLQPRAVLGQPLRLRFGLPRLTGKLTVEAWLVRCELDDGQVSWAVRFTRIAPRVRRMIRTFVFVGHARVRDYDENAA